ncbi:hypothetical protein PCE1_000242 [Barthelona sp. PCE]
MPKIHNPNRLVSFFARLSQADEKYFTDSYINNCLNPQCGGLSVQHLKCQKCGAMMETTKRQCRKMKLRFPNDFTTIIDAVIYGNEGSLELGGSYMFTGFFDVVFERKKQIALFQIIGIEPPNVQPIPYTLSFRDSKTTKKFLVSQFATNISGCDMLKLLVLITLVSQTTQIMTSRQNIFFLLFGESGSGKTSLLMEARRIFPNTRFIYADQVTTKTFTADFDSFGVWGGTSMLAVDELQVLSDIQLSQLLRTISTSVVSISHKTATLEPHKVQIPVMATVDTPNSKMIQAADICVSTIGTSSISSIIENLCVSKEESINLSSYIEMCQRHVPEFGSSALNILKSFIRNIRSFSQVILKKKAETEVLSSIVRISIAHAKLLRKPSINREDIEFAFRVSKIGNMHMDGIVTNEVKLL